MPMPLAVPGPSQRRVKDIGKSGSSRNLKRVKYYCRYCQRTTYHREKHRNCKTKHAEDATKTYKRKAKAPSDSRKKMKMPPIFKMPSKTASPDDLAVPATSTPPSDYEVVNDFPAFPDELDFPETPDPLAENDYDMSSFDHFNALNQLFPDLEQYGPSFVHQWS